MRYAMTIALALLISCGDAASPTPDYLTANTAPAALTACQPYQGYDTCLYTGTDAAPAYLASVRQSIGPNPVVVIAGYSNTAQSTCSGATAGGFPCASWTFIPQAKKVSGARFIPGALGGQGADEWDSPADTNYDHVRTLLTSKGLTEADVQVAWYWPSHLRPTCALPQPCADALSLAHDIHLVALAMRARYPNLRLIYLSAREYAGFAIKPLNPEPYAYESGLAVKWAVEADSGLAWGPYLWNSTDPVSLYEKDGTHRNQAGETLTAARALTFFQGECWFNGTVCP